MKQILFLAISFLLTACITMPNHIDTNYAGSNKGTVLIGIGAAPGNTYHSYTFIFRKTLTATEHENDTGFFSYKPDAGLTGQKPDYVNGDEPGIVVVSTLPPGQYEIVNFSVSSGGYVVPFYNYSKTPFSIKFIVEPGKTTYLGNYQAVAINGQNNFSSEPGGVIFNVENRADKDFSLAQKKKSNLPAISENSTPDPDKVNNYYIVNKIPEEILSRQRKLLSVHEFLWGD